MSGRITKYEVVTANSKVALEDQVLNAIQHGWEPLGGVAIIHIAQGARFERSEAFDQYAQAIIKRDDA